MSWAHHSSCPSIVSGVLMCGCGAGGQEWSRSRLSVFAECEEALGPRGSGRARFLHAACGDSAVTAVLLQPSSHQLHQVKPGLLFPPTDGCREESFSDFPLFFPQASGRVHRGLRQNVAELFTRHEAEPEGDGGRSGRHSECADKQASAPRGGNHR